jgi:type I site-specific restriction-modification system R (restriction) subunit
LGIGASALQMKPASSPTAAAPGPDRPHIHRDVAGPPEEHRCREAEKKKLMDLISGDVELRSKRELIEQFINENLPLIEDADNIPDEFERFWQEQKVLALQKRCEEEHLDREQFSTLGRSTPMSSTTRSL